MFVSFRLSACYCYWAENLVTALGYTKECCNCERFRKLDKLRQEINAGLYAESER